MPFSLFMLIVIIFYQENTKIYSQFYMLLLYDTLSFVYHAYDIKSCAFISSPTMAVYEILIPRNSDFKIEVQRFLNLLRVLHLLLFSVICLSEISHVHCS